MACRIPSELSCQFIISSDNVSQALSRSHSRRFRTIATSVVVVVVKAVTGLRGVLYRVG